MQMIDVKGLWTRYCDCTEMHASPCPGRTGDISTLPRGQAMGENALQITKRLFTSPQRQITFGPHNKVQSTDRPARHMQWASPEMLASCQAYRSACAPHQWAS